jgi:hypothetical protein
MGDGAVNYTVNDIPPLYHAVVIDLDYQKTDVFEKPGQDFRGESIKMDRRIKDVVRDAGISGFFPYSSQQHAEPMTIEFFQPPQALEKVEVGHPDGNNPT